MNTRVASHLTYVCPLCKGPLSNGPSDYGCIACDRRYPTFMGIPDFRVFPDPYISIESEHSKVLALTEGYEDASLEVLVDRYWELTPGVPAGLVAEFKRLALEKPARARKTWESVVGRGIADPGWNLLELGCSTAGLLSAVSPDVAHGVGVDIAFRWLVIAKKRLEERGVSNVTLVCACAEFLPFADGAFDWVVGEDVLDHVRDQQAAVGESARVLNGDGGRLFLTTPNRFSLGPDPHVWVWGVGFLPGRLRDAYVRLRRGVSYGPIQPVSVGRLRSLLAAAGLVAHEVGLPELRGRDLSGYSRWHRFQARVYETLRAVPFARRLLRHVGPTLRVIATNVQTRPSVGASAASSGAAYRQANAAGR